METINSYQLYGKLLRLCEEWEVRSVSLDEASENLHIEIGYKFDYWVDKSTGEEFPLFDFRAERTWRHLDCMDYKTIVHCRLPRIKTCDGKVHTIEYDWAEAGFSHTKKFEDLCIKAFQATHCQKSAAAFLGISDDKMCGIMHAAVERGLARRDLSNVREISLDEKSYGKGHQYVTVLTESKTGAVLDVERARTEAAANRLLQKALSPDRLTCIQTACCDMWEAFLNALKKTVPMPRLYTTNFTLSSI
jgi:transposase